MSTNYYWANDPVILPTGDEVRLDRLDPALHIGKSSGGRFIWAQRRATVERIGRERPGEPIIQNEYGERMDCARFFREIAGLPEDTGSIGTWFF